METRKRKPTEIHLIQFQLFAFYKPASLLKNSHGRVLSIRVFIIQFPRGNYQPTVPRQKHSIVQIVSLRGRTLPHHVISLNQ